MIVLKKAMNPLYFILVFFTLLFVLSSTVSAAIYIANGTEIPEDDISSSIKAAPSPVFGYVPAGQIIFFTNIHCSACHMAEEFLHDFSARHPEISLVTYDLFDSPENRTIFENYKKKYHRTFLSTPSILVGNLTIEGTQDMRNHLDEILLIQNEKKEPGGLLSGIFPDSFQKITASGEEIPLLLIVGAGLLDGINPCAFAVLVFLLVYLMAQKNRRRMLAAGLVYTGAVFIFYFLSGVGIFSVIQTTGTTTVFSIGAGCIALIAGLLMLKDAIIPKEKPTLSIPSSQSGLINRIVKMATLPAAFILGILVGMFELPCTGGIYLSILSMISMKSNPGQALGYLFVYNIAFVVPLLIIIVLVTFGLSPERVNEWRLEQRRALRAVIGLVLIVFGIFILNEVAG